MKVALDWLTCDRVGLLLNFVGTVLLAFSFGRNLEGAYQRDTNGRKVELASFTHPRRFRVGVALVAFGFLVQLLT